MKSQSEGKKVKPVDYTKLDGLGRGKMREKYLISQNRKCFYCGESLDKEPPKNITDKPINWSLFPENFLKYPIHLQHNHQTNMTEGVVHNYCNAVMWQYEHK